MMNTVAVSDGLVQMEPDSDGLETNINLLGNHEKLRKKMHPPISVPKTCINFEFSKWRTETLVIDPELN